MVYEILVCPDTRHAWSRWIDDDSQLSSGWDVKGLGGNQSRRLAAAGDDPGALVAVADWASHRAYRFVSPIRLQRDVIAAVREIGVRPVHKRTKFVDLVPWVINDLPRVAPDHPRTKETVAMATYWWRYGR